MENKIAHVKVTPRLATAISLSCSLLLTACATIGIGDSGGAAQITPLSKVTYDGNSNDLLTGGLGKTGLLAAAPPALADNNKPSVTELRTRAIHANYRAIVDPSPAGGFTRFFGPNIDLLGKDTLGEGKIAGDEYLAIVRIGQASATVMVQVPRQLNKANPCIVTAASSGSRGIYGAIGTAGDWGLKRGCVVAYTDKGTGTGFHLLSTNQTLDWNGVLGPVSAANASFKAPGADVVLKAYADAQPNRVAVKQAHDQQNGERLWGQFTLAAVRYALTVLNGLEDDRKGKYSASNVLVIASSISNGAYAALQAAEQDAEGLIDAVVATEPNVSIAQHKGYGIQQGNKAIPVVGLSLLNYTTLLNLYTPCAALDPSLATSALNVIPVPLREARCAALVAAGYLKSTTVAAQAAESITKLLDQGIAPESLTLLPSHYTINVYQSISVAYAMQYGRFGVTEELCGYSYAATAPANVPQGANRPLTAAGTALLFASSNGIVPTGGINLVNQKADGGPTEDRASVVAGKADMNTAGAICLREVATGRQADGSELKDPIRKAWANRVNQGLEQTQMSGKLRKKPTIIVAPRGDAVLPINHTGRAYYAINQNVDDTLVRYYEVTNTQHLDVINGVAGISNAFVPIYPYFAQSMNLMWNHLVSARQLPPSQLVRNKTRAMKDGKVEDLATANLAPISQQLDGDSLIRMRNTTLVIPE